MKAAASERCSTSSSEPRIPFGGCSSTVRRLAYVPELPEVETIARTLRPQLIGMTILGADVRWARTVAAPSVRSFKRQIQGQVIRDVGRRAKFLRLQLTDLELLVHLRMSGDLALKNAVSTA